MSLREGILLPLTIVAAFVSAFAVLATPAVPYRELLSAVSRIPAVGDAETDVTIPRASEDFAFPPPWQRQVELEGFELSADGPLSVVTHVTKGAGHHGQVDLTPGKVFAWHKPGPTENVFDIIVKEWTATNLTDKDIHLRMTAHTDIEYPEVRVVPLAAIATIIPYLVYLAFRRRVSQNRRGRRHHVEGIDGPALVSGHHHRRSNRDSDLHLHPLQHAG